MKIPTELLDFGGVSLLFSSKRVYLMRLVLLFVSIFFLKCATAQPATIKQACDLEQYKGINISSAALYVWSHQSTCDPYINLMFSKDLTNEVVKILIADGYMMFNLERIENISLYGLGEYILYEHSSKMTRDDFMDFCLNFEVHTSFSITSYAYENCSEFYKAAQNDNKMALYCSPQMTYDINAYGRLGLVTTTVPNLVMNIEEFNCDVEKNG